MSSVLITPAHHLTSSPRIQERLHQGELTQLQVDDFQDFLTQVDREFSNIVLLRIMPILGGFKRVLQRMMSCDILFANFRCFPINFWLRPC